MTRDEAIRLRAAQLNGAVIGEATLAQAMEVIRTSVRIKPGRKPRSDRGKAKKPGAVATGNPFDLSDTQAQVMDLTLEGATVAQIGKRLEIDVSTVGTHLFRARERLGATSKLHAALIWDRHKRAAPLEFMVRIEGGKPVLMEAACPSS